ncbi:MAG: prepilin-type N-terminal cleavage/methylation domain-containing protein [Deltaproteobacteria bacterium]|nr:prepilin-type N-terminal cleavage/methylation domain-containing protein [Deltaproteobacteria bacterium]
MNTFLKNMKRRQDGFTLLELIVVIAILAIIAGGLLVSYDGLEAKAAKGQATFDIAAVDKGVRTFKVVGGAYPNEFDALLTDNATAANCAAGTSCSLTTGGFYAGLHNNLQGTDGDLTTADNKLGLYTLTAADVTALNNAGITQVRYIANATNTVGNIPNRDFDDAPRGKGVLTTLIVGSVVPVVESEGLGAAAACTSPFSSPCNRLNDITGLNPAIQHIVLALGVGNNSSIVSDATGGNSAGFAEAPFYTDVAKNQYGRYMALFHLASDTNDDGVIAAGEQFSTARFVGILDPKGDWLDEEYAEFTGQKQ